MMRLGTLQTAAFVELAICWIVWCLAFVKPSRQAAGHEKVERAPASRWGIFFNFLGFACIYAYVRPVGFHKAAWELVASMIVGPPNVVLVWSAAHALGKHWRYEAALSEDHQLVKTGAYAYMRHPIYASLSGMLLATGFAYTWWPMLIAGVVLFLIGIEIRVHAEERLLYERFQDEFVEYRARVRAYIPFVR